MAEVGSDLWSPAAVSVLKQYLQSELGTVWAAAIQELDETTGANENKSNGVAINGDTDTEAIEPVQSKVKQALEPDVRKDILIQYLFDIFVLQNVLDTSHGATVDLKSIVSSLESQLDLDGPLYTRLQVGAQDYWKRTNLLFGPLGSL